MPYTKCTQQTIAYGILVADAPVEHGWPFPKSPPKPTHPQFPTGPRP